jgi:DEAD/DEAH box helicase domain-containing protein
MAAADLAELIASWAEDDEFGPSIAAIREIPARDADMVAVDLNGDVATRLAEHGIEQFYRHQADAIAALRGGSDVAVVAGTASGKSLAYQAPIAEAIAEDPTATALVIYPTKALAQDQLRGFGRVGTDDLVVGTYDGDTPQEDRRWIRRNANVILTNPDMLHVGILPNHARWRSFLSRLRYVVVDEMHSFKGIFGSHLALILRRLRRLTELTGADPRIVMTSATIGNPGNLARQLTGREVTVVDRDGSSAGRKHIVLWNPELEDVEKGIRRSPLTDASRLLAELVGNEVPTIVFARSRKSSELVFRWSRDRLPGAMRTKIAPYRAGYLAADRRTTEEALFSGELLGVVSTNALELGIDVGGLDAAVMTTFPGTIASFRQQAGRSGRSLDDSLAVLIAGQDALDQHYMHHPDELFERRAEAAVVNPSNPDLLRAHLRCAAHEDPLVPEDVAFFGHEMEELATDLVAAGELGVRGGRLFWSGGGSPAFGMDIRTSGGQPYRIIDRKTQLLGTVDEGRAFSQTHPGAVYLHQGDSYVVDRLDLDLREVWVRREDPGYYTQPKIDKDMTVLSVADMKPLGPLRVLHGRVEVASEVLAYQRKSIATGERLETVPIQLPRRSYSTQAVWWEIPTDVIVAAGIPAHDVPGTLHAVEHTAIAMMPLQTVCDRWDIGGLSSASHPAFGGPGFFIYDGHPGGAGIAPIAFERAGLLFEATLDALERCPCAVGCPSCVQSPKCGNFNDPLSKSGAISLLRVVLG